MKVSILCTVVVVAAFSACGGGATNTANVAATTPNQELSSAERPKRIVDLMASRGEQDTAAPTLKIVEPKGDATLDGETVKVKIELSGDLKGYKTGMDETSHTGNHIHVILDNQPYEAYYNLEQEFELRNVADGDHTLRVFPSRPWHESYKNEGAFQMVKFTVKNGGGDAKSPTTTNNGNTMANAATPEGKNMKMSVAGTVDPTKPLLTYSRPKGEYKADDTNAIMFDFWLANAKLTGDGGEYRVRYTVDGGEAKFIDKWEPIWLTGWTDGRHLVSLELVDKQGKPVDNGGYNTTIRDFMVLK
ncbi:MAG: hypothetical protein WBO10_01685 [Pyrinomonadaceae bacterium]